MSNEFIFLEIQEHDLGKIIASIFNLSAKNKFKEMTRTIVTLKLEKLEQK